MKITINNNNGRGYVKKSTELSVRQEKIHVVLNRMTKVRSRIAYAITQINQLQAKFQMKPDSSKRLVGIYNKIYRKECMLIELYNHRENCHQIAC